MFNDTNTITTVTNPKNTNRIIKFDKPPINVYNQTILKNKKGLYIFIDGTGRIYKAKSLENDKICFDHEHAVQIGTRGSPDYLRASGLKPEVAQYGA